MNEAAKLPTIYTDPSQSEATRQIVMDMDMLEEKLTNMPNVSTAEECEVVSEYRAQFRAKGRDLDKERKQMTAGARATIAMVNDKYNVIIERARRCTQLADNKLLPYMQERERKRREDERKREEAEEAERQAAADLVAAEEEADRVAAETQSAEQLAEKHTAVEDARDGLDQLRRTPVAKPEAKSVKGVLGSGTQLRKVWKYRISHFSDIPDEWLLPEEERLDRGKLHAVAKRDQANAYVPGIEFYPEDTLASRPGVQK